MLTLYNSLTRTQELFEPNLASCVKIYVCGMTVYDDCHIGHARSMLCFDMLVRYLRARGYTVQYVRNITDLDDKIIKRAAELNETYQDLTERYIGSLHRDAEALHLIPPDLEPRATEYIPHMIALIQRLMDKKIAYAGANGDVFYDVGCFPSYGTLSHKDLEGQEAGARVEVNEGKHNPLDFVLWKQAKPNEPSWDSPWGKGRPGWHIECSAMAMHCFGETFDIHGGGSELQFPHHENERAQSEGATGQPFVKTWMHVGLLQIKGEKMSKSLGNFFSISEVLQKYPSEVIRYFLLSCHYRSQLTYSDPNLNQAHLAITRLYQSILDLEIPQTTPNSTWETRFYHAMDNDLNTPEALAVLFELSHEINRARSLPDLQKAGILARTLLFCAQILGLMTMEPQMFLRGEKSDVISDIESLIELRNKAREARNWKAADEIRARLHQKGIELADKSTGTSWQRSKPE